MIHCPKCHSFDVIEYDDGWLCRDCGLEFDDPRPARKHKPEEE